MIPELIRRITELERRLDDLDQPPVDDPIEKCFGNGVAMYLSLPGLRGYWPGSSMGTGGILTDVSGQGRDLTMNGLSFFSAVNFHCPEVQLDGANDWYSRADEAGLDILGTETYVSTARQGITMGGWFNFDRLTNPEELMSKWGGVIGDKSYILMFRGDVGGDPVEFGIGNGVATDTMQFNDFDPNVTDWFFIVGRYNRVDLELTVWVGASGEIDTLDSDTQATAFAAIQNGAADFTIGARSGGTYKLDGSFSNCFLCAYAFRDGAIESLYRRTRMWYA